jgi:hypothetical protein
VKPDPCAAKPFVWRPFGSDGEFLRDPWWRAYLAACRDPAAGRRALENLRETYPPSWALREDAAKHPVAYDVAFTYGRHHLLELATALEFSSRRQRERLLDPREYIATRAELSVGLMLRSLGARVRAEPLGEGRLGPDWGAEFGSCEMVIEVKCPEVSQVAKRVMGAQSEFFFAFMEAFERADVDAQTWLTLTLREAVFKNEVFGSLAGREQLREQGRGAALIARERFRAVDGAVIPLGDFGSARVTVAPGTAPALTLMMDGLPADGDHESNRLRTTIEHACTQVAAAAGLPGVIALVTDQNLALAWSASDIAEILAEPWSRPLSGAILIRRHAAGPNLLTTVQVIPGLDSQPVLSTLLPVLRKCDRGHLHADPLVDPPAKCPIEW